MFRIIVFGLGFWVILNWFLMISIGIVHIHWLHSMPTAGFGDVFLMSGGILVSGALAACVAQAWAWLTGAGA